jgi:hypothetical protein
MNGMGRKFFSPKSQGVNNTNMGQALPQQGTIKP